MGLRVVLRSLIGAVAACAVGVGALADTQPAGAEPQMAVYRWAAPKGPRLVDQFAAWIGRPDVWAEDFLATDRWQDISNPDWLLKPWSQWLKQRSDRKLLLSVPMLPGPRDRSGPASGPGANQPVSLAQGAAGAYNEYFRTLAKQLVAYGIADQVILRLGWEFNGNWYAWSAGDDPASWVQFWRQIVDAMRSVDGAGNLVFCWNPNNGSSSCDATAAYPGDDYVDVIAIDSYDQCWLADTYPYPPDAGAQQILARQQRAWEQDICGNSRGLRFWADFARDHNKPFAIAEWGVFQRKDGHGGLDNPYYIEQMHEFIMDPQNNIVFHCYFDVEAGDGQHQLSPGDDHHQTLFPQASRKFRELFGAQPVD